MQSQFEYLWQRTELRYGTAPGQRPHRQQTRTYYDNAAHLLPTRTVQLLGPQDSIVTHTRYPTDYAMPASGPVDAPGRALLTLGQQHRLATVVEQVTWRHRNGQARVVQAALQTFAEVPLRAAPPLGQRPRVNRSVIVPRQRLTLRLDAPLAAATFPPTAVAAGRLAYTTAYEPVLEYEHHDRAGRPVQVRQLPGTPTCFVWGERGTELLAEVKQAAAATVAFTSFEEAAPGGFRYTATTGQRVAGGRTGHWAYRLDGRGGVGRDSLPAGRYDVLLWAQAPQPPTLYAAGAAPTVERVATAPGGWNQFWLRVHLPAAGSVRLDVPTGSATVVIDELRLHPAGGQMTSYTYDPLIGMTSQTDPAGRTIFYEYDALGRLQRVRDEQGRVLSENEYRYARP